MTTLRLVFMGSCGFALRIVQRIQQDFPICGVFTAPPRPKGRGYAIQRTCVHDYAESMGWPVWTPATFKDESAVADLRNLNPTVVIVASYGLLLPQCVLDIPRAGCVNVHPSILPRWRGASPLVYPILTGDTETGVAIMVMDSGMDTGPVLVQKYLPIVGRMTTAVLAEQLANMGAAALCKVLPDYLKGRLIPIPQSPEGGTLAPKIQKEMGLLNWSESAWTLLRKIDALQPWPGTWGMINGQKVTILQADAVNCPGSGNTAQDCIQPFTMGSDVNPNDSNIKNSGAKHPEHSMVGSLGALGNFNGANLFDTVGTIVSCGQFWAIVCGERTLLCPTQLRSSRGKIMDAAAFRRGHGTILSL
jgi:methionyl-tRNA formyltransferase